MAEELEEEVYEAAMGAVIERDFFPDLPRLRSEVAERKGGESVEMMRVASLMEEDEDE